MVKRKKVSILLVVFVMVMSFVTACGKTTTVGDVGEKAIKIGISQIAEHPALDASRKGFIDALASKGYEEGKNLKIDYQNAQGDIPLSQTIAQSFVSDGVDLIFAIATPSAQSAYNATKDIPILITAVTDPVQAGLVKSMKTSGTNVAGTSDMAPTDKQFKLIKELVPNAKKVGIIYNTSEVNSEVQVEKAKEVGAGLQLEVLTKGVTSTNEVAQALDSILDGIDVLYVPTDNIMASSIPLVASKCLERKIPVIGAESAHVEGGALATEGINYYKLGYETGLMAVEVVEGKNPKDMGVSTFKETKLVINENTLNSLNISLPDDLKDRAEMIGSEKNE